MMNILPVTQYVHHHDSLQSEALSVTFLERTVYKSLAYLSFLLMVALTALIQLHNSIPSLYI